MAESFQTQLNSQKLAIHSAREDLTQELEKVSEINAHSNDGALFNLSELEQKLHTAVQEATKAIEIHENSI